MREILAPLGGYESLAAALNAGADAVYIGMRQFSARKNAENFSDEELLSAVIECHKRGVKVYIALNTLMYDKELPDAAKCIAAAAKYGADGIIVQDLGAAALAKRVCPDIPLHASTQMTLNSVSGICAAKKLGFSRVVIGRELSKNDIEEISRNTDVELEIFVHGALCVSVSGQCYMSSILGGRSGNRGLCAQPCRLAFTCGNRENVLSLKDMSLVEHLNDKELSDIESFKIEGRMKRPEYVACAVNACRSELDGKEYDSRRLEEIFSRGGLTDGYYTEKLDDMNGVRGIADVESSQKALNGIKELYKSEYPRIKADIHASVKAGTPISVSAECEYGKISVTTDKIPEKARNIPLDRAAVCERLGKLGGTEFYAGNITADVGEGLFLSAAALNSVRRLVCDKLSEIVLEKCTPEYKINAYAPLEPYPSKQNGYIHYRAEVANKSQLEQALKLEFGLIYAPMEILNEKTPDKDRIAVAPPLILSGCEEEVRKRLEKLRKAGYTKGFAQTLAHAELLKKCGFELYGGYRMNILNSLSCSVCEEYGFKDITLSFEGTAQTLSNISSPIPRGIVAYGRLPLMLLRRCPIANGKTCGIPSGECCHGSIYDRFGNEISILCGGNYVEPLNPDVLILSDKPHILKKFDFVVLKFTTEEHLSALLNIYKNHIKPDGKLTRGLYFRGAE